MKRFFAILTFTLSLACISTGVSAQSDPAAKASTADIQFEVETHDFGLIKQGDPTSFEFVFKNTGKEPLVLENVQASCGCTVPTWTKEPIQPGKTGAITVSYNSNHLGMFSKNITVYSNAKTGNKMLTIKGNVISEPKSPIIIDQR